MYPILLKIGHLTMYSWGVAFVVSFVAALLLSLKRARRFGLEPDAILELSIVILIAALAGSRFWYVFTHIWEFQGRWLNTINPFRDGVIGIQGLSMTGGIVLVLFASLAFAWLRRVNMVALGDVILPGFLLSEAMQRMGGCLMSGCCFGRPTSSVFGIVFPPEAEASRYFPNIPLWPTQMMTAFLALSGLGLILWLECRFRFSGATFWSGLIYYAIARFVIDQFRYYAPEQILGRFGWIRFNNNHPLLIGILLLSIFMWARGWQRKT